MAGYTFWQASDTASVGGITGQSDLDYMQGAPPSATASASAGGSVQLQTLNSLAGQPVSYTAGTLPACVTLSSGGLLSWSSAVKVGEYQVAATPASKATPAATVVPSAIVVTLKVHGTISLGTASRSATVGTPVGLGISYTGTDANAGFKPTFTVTGLPPGLAQTANGRITGWPSRPGAYKVTVHAADALGGSATATFTYTINAAADSGPAGQVRQVGGSGKCLNDPAGNTANGTRLTVWSCDGKSNQRWTAVQDGTLRTGGKCLGTAGDSSANGARLELVTCNAGDGAQHWLAGTDGQLVNPQSGKCLDIPAASAANGTQPVLEPCANSTSQPNEHWIRRPPRSRPARTGPAWRRRARPRWCTAARPRPPSSGSRIRTAPSGSAPAAWPRRAPRRAPGSLSSPAPGRPPPSGSWPGRADRHRAGQRRLRPVRERPADQHERPPGARPLRQPPRDHLARRIAPTASRNPHPSPPAVPARLSSFGAERVMRTPRYARRAAVALTALGVVGAVAAAGPAHGATTPPWRITHTFPRSSGIAAIAATGTGNAWAAGYQCTSSGECTNGSLLVEHWNGKTWQGMKPPGGLGGLAPGQSGSAVAASSPGNVWILADSEEGSGNRTVAQHWTGKGWAKPTAFPEWAEVSSVVTTGAGNAWAFGQLETSPASYVAHYNGARWTRVSLPLYAQAASAVSARNIWAVGSWALGKAPKGASPFAVEHWTGSAWHPVPVPALRLPKGAQGVQAESVVAEGASDVWAAAYLTDGQGVGTGIVLLHWNGRKFAQVTVPYPVTGPFYLSGDGTGGVWLAATRIVKSKFGSYLYRYSSGRWTQIAAPNEPKNTTQLNAMTLIPGTHSVWAAGAGFSPTIDPGQGQGLILKYGP